MCGASNGNGGSAIDLNATGATDIGRIGQDRQRDTASPDSTFARTNGATANRAASIAALTASAASRSAIRATPSVTRS